MVKSCVFFAERTEFLNIIYTSFGFKGLILFKMFLTFVINFMHLAPKRFIHARNESLQIQHIIVIVIISE
jgi:hypothetical protein